MFKTIGICGVGNMGYAIGKGIAQARNGERKNLLLYNIHPAQAQAAAKDFGSSAAATEDFTAFIAAADLLIVAVKPHIVADVLRKAAPFLKPEQVVLSVAAGVDLAALATCLPARSKIIRAMPNTPVVVNAGMTSLTPNEAVTASELEEVLCVFRCFGRAEVVDEALIDAVIGISGSSPAYVYMFIEALADGAVLEGMPRDKAYTFAAQAVMGAAKAVLETGIHPGKLKDNVCSPGGTTIAAVHTLEEYRFRAAIIHAVQTAAERNRKMGSKK